MGFCIAYAALLLSSQIVTELANKNVLILSACIIICIARSKQDEVKKKNIYRYEQLNKSILNYVTELLANEK